MTKTNYVRKVPLKEQIQSTQILERTQRIEKVSIIVPKFYILLGIIIKFNHNFEYIFIIRLFFTAGRGSEDANLVKSECMSNAAPVVVGAASVGTATAALLGIEMSKAKAHEKTGQNYIISEMYEDDNMDDFAMEADQQICISVIV